jgi:predicted outer membrane repeat protein
MAIYGDFFLHYEFIIAGSNNPLVPIMVFENSVATDSGGVINSGGYSRSSMLHNTFVENNIANYSGGFIDAYNSTITIEQHNFKQNMSHIYQFKNNIATYGGAISISNTSLMLVGKDSSPVQLTFESNVANDQGGAIYADTNSTIFTSKGTFLFLANAAIVRIKMFGRVFAKCLGSD